VKFPADGDEILFGVIAQRDVSRAHNFANEASCVLVDGNNTVAGVSGRKSRCILRIWQGAHCCLKEIVEVTIYSHNMTMKKVGIARLKSRLSEYLRAVRRGETIMVLDRQTPVASILPVRQRAELRIQEPAAGSPALNRIALPEPLNLKIDIVELLLEERQRLR